MEIARRRRRSSVSGPRYFIDASSWILAREEDRRAELRKHLQSANASLLFNEALLREMVQTTNVAKRTASAALIRPWLKSGTVVVADWSRQLGFRAERFLSGRPSGRELKRSSFDKALKRIVRQPTRLSRSDAELLIDGAQTSASSWLETHASFRDAAQELVGGRLATPDDELPFIEAHRTSELPQAVVKEVLNSSLWARLEPRVEEFIETDEIFRSWVETFLLTAHRQGLQHESASSKKDPGWPDLSHSALIRVVDVFVTDDTRQRKAIERIVELFGIRAVVQDLTALLTP